MVFGFGSSSSSASSSSTNQAGSSTPVEAPNREQRAACWSHRDAYFQCLDKNGILQPGDEASQGVCGAEKKGYEGACSKSWFEYFNKRRMLELRAKATQEAQARSRDRNPANAGR